MIGVAETLMNLGFEPGTDFLVQDDGEGPYIAKWLSKKPQPDEAEMSAARARIEADQVTRPLRDALAASDLDMARIAEEEIARVDALIALLLGKGVISQADADGVNDLIMPRSREKMADRVALRERLESHRLVP